VQKFLLSLIFAGLLLVGGRASAAMDKPWPIDEMMGKPDAPITIIEYASLTCPHCADFAEKTLPEIKKNWIDTGKAKLIFRDLPTAPAALAEAAAMISHCSGDADRYFIFLDTFYHSQRNWIQASNPLEALKGIARLGGMGPDQVDKCLADRDLLKQINDRVEDAGTRYNVDSTPSFIVNGKMIGSGFMDYAEFVKFLNTAK
jgi:protein-disulfide isomerase